MGQPEPLVPVASTFPSVKDIVMNKKILSLREHYDLHDRQGTRIGEADGNFIQFPAKFSVFDQTHSEVMHLQGKILSFRKEFTMYDPSGNQLGVIRKKLLKLVGSEYWLERNGVEFMRIYGNFTEHDYQMAVNQVQVAQVHKKWVSLRDQFSISITGEIDARTVIWLRHCDRTRRGQREAAPEPVETGLVVYPLILRYTTFGSYLMPVSGFCLT